MMKIRIFILCIVMVISLTSLHAQYANSVVVEPLLQTDTTSIGQLIAYPRVNQAEVTILKITMPPGSRTGLHKHDIPLFGYMLQGALTVVREGHEPRVFKTGEALSEMIDTYHEGINEGKEDVVLIAFYLGGDGKALATRKPDK